MEIQENIRTAIKPRNSFIPDITVSTKINEDQEYNDLKSEDIIEEEDIVRVDVEAQCSLDSVDGKKESNQFASKKATAEGMMDVALLTANANQLRFLMAYNSNSKTYVLIMTLIISSLILQTIVGFAFIFKRYCKCRNDKQKARILSEFLIATIFLVTLINIFIATFSTTD
ncbi:ninjurin-B [Condylostylus longicornis]|uniref:ninjurin-B n=1 Tax=Condylostylus longicornis TaxID=2530218 RepID=UPI00244E3D07|nr:ninjurin-B [Condylostylus longicornis]